MKKLILVAALAFGTYAVQAQSFYLGADIGYGVSSPASGNLGVTQVKDLSGGNDSYDENIYGTIGAGLNFTLTPGYMFNNHIGVELGVNYFVGNKVTMEETITNDSDVYDQTVANSNQLRLMPSLVISTTQDGIFGYAKFGLTMPVMGSTVGVREFSQPAANMPEVKIETTTNGNPTIGFRGVAGVGYAFSENLSLNLEVFYTNLTIKPKTRTIDSYTIKGEDKLEGSKLYDRQIDYVDRLDNNSNNEVYNSQYDKNKPKEELANKTDFSQVGLSIGVKYCF